MSERMERIKQSLKERKVAKREQGGEWVRMGVCQRCGQCCNILLIAPEEYYLVQAEAKKRGMIPEDGVLDPICQNYGVAKDGKKGCTIHHTPEYQARFPGCGEFPATKEKWYRVMEHCGFEFIWVETRPRVAGKARRAKA